MKKPDCWNAASFIIILLLSMLACRPVITVGWQEIGILVLILAVLMGPALYRLWRRLDEFQNWKANRHTKRDD